MKKIQGVAVTQVKNLGVPCIKKYLPTSLWTEATESLDKTAFHFGLLSVKLDVAALF